MSDKRYYCVTLRRTGTQEIELVITADNMDEAEKLGLEKANELPWPTISTTYTVIADVFPYVNPDGN